MRYAACVAPDDVGEGGTTHENCGARGTEREGAGLKETSSPEGGRAAAEAAANAPKSCKKRAIGARSGKGELQGNTRTPAANRGY
jgi:hypothetical protein